MERVLLEAATVVVVETLEIETDAVTVAVEDLETEIEIAIVVTEVVEDVSMEVTAGKAFAVIYFWKHMVNFACYSLKPLPKTR